MAVNGQMAKERQIKVLLKVLKFPATGDHVLRISYEERHKAGEDIKKKKCFFPQMPMVTEGFPKYVLNTINK